VKTTQPYGATSAPEYERKILEEDSELIASTNEPAGVIQTQLTIADSMVAQMWSLNAFANNPIAFTSEFSTDVTADQHRHRDAALDQAIFSSKPAHTGSMVFSDTSGSTGRPPGRPPTPPLARENFDRWLMPDLMGTETSGPEETGDYDSDFRFDDDPVARHTNLW